VVLIDEFSMMLENFAESKRDPIVVRRFLYWFREMRLSQRDPVLTFLIGGSKSIPFWLSHFRSDGALNDVFEERITAFDRDVAVNFIEELRKAHRLTWSGPEVLAAVLEHVQPAEPFFLQLLGQALALDPEVRSRERVVGVSDVRTGVLG